jgi:hypothetical protein
VDTDERAGGSGEVEVREGVQGEAGVQDTGVTKNSEGTVKLTMEQYRAMVMERLRREARLLSNKATTRMEIQDQIKLVAGMKRARKADRLAKQLRGVESR